MNPFGPTPRYNRQIRMRDLRPSAVLPLGGGTGTSVGINSSSETIPAYPSGLIVTWDFAIDNTGGFWTSGSPTRLTAGISGWYLAWFHSVIINADAAIVFTAEIIQNDGGGFVGSWSKHHVIDSGGVPPYTVTRTLSVPLYLVAGEYMTFNTYWDSGGTKVLQPSTQAALV